MLTKIKTGDTYNKKSCSQHGSLPLTVTVVDLTFCNFKVTYVLNCDAVMSYMKGKKTL